MWFVKNIKMKRILIILILAFNVVIFAQNDSIKSSFNNWNGGGIDLQSNYLITPVSKKIVLDSLKKKSNNNENLIIFFFPSEDSLKKDSYIRQIKDLSKKPEFNSSFLIGVPYITGIKDEDNVYFEKHLVQDVECFIYTSNYNLLDRAQKLKKDFKINKSLDVALSIYNVSINKEAVCVRENRINYIGENLLIEFLNPNYNDHEKIENLYKSFEALQKKNVDLENKTNKMNSEINQLKEEILKLKDSNIELREKLKLDK